jgi:hypothetical protein
MSAYRQHLIRRATMLTCLALLMVAANPSEALAKELLGNPFSSFHGMQSLEKEEERVRALRIPLVIKLRSWENRTMGLRLRLAATFASASLFDLLDQDLKDIRVSSFVPGMEIIFPLSRTSMVRPFFDVGAGTSDATDDLTFLFDLGLRSEFLFPSQDFILGLEPGFQLSANTGGSTQRDAALNPFLSMSARRIMGFRIGGKRPDAEVYFEGGYNFLALEYTSVSTSADDVELNFEAGLGVGFSRGQPRIGPIPIPRLRVGYRFGDLEGFRVRIGGDWLTKLDEPSEVVAPNENPDR